jgi:hypothetical protein
MPRRSGGGQVVVSSLHRLEATHRPLHSLETPLEIQDPLPLEGLRLAGEANNNSSSKLDSAVPATQAMVGAGVKEEEATNHLVIFLRKGGANLGTTASSLMILVLVVGIILALVAEVVWDQPIPTSAAIHRLDNLVDDNDYSSSVKSRSAFRVRILQSYYSLYEGHQCKSFTSLLFKSDFKLRYFTSVTFLLLKSAF